MGKMPHADLKRVGYFMVLGVFLGGMAIAWEPEGLQFSRLTVADGLAHASVYSVLQDQRGFLWVGTGEGLNRFDGRRFIAFHYDPEEPNSLSTSNFGKIAEDANGVLWLGTWGGGLNRYDPSTGLFQHFRHDSEDPTSLSADRIEALAVDDDGAIWVAADREGLNRLDPQSGRFERFNHVPDAVGGLPTDEVKAVHVDPQGTLWVGTNRGLCRWMENAFDCERHEPGVAGSLPGDALRAIASDAEGVLWVGTRRSGVARRSPETGRWESYQHDPGDPNSLPDNAVASLLVDSYGRLWVGTYNRGLALLDPARSSLDQPVFRVFSHDADDPASLSHNRVEALFEDRGRNLWIGTRGGGLNRIDLKPRKFSSYEHEPSVKNSLPHANVMAVAVDGSAGGNGRRNLWIGTDGGGLTLVDRSGPSLEFQHFRHDPADENTLSSDRIWSILPASDGTLWAGSYESGLNHIVKKDGRVTVQRFGTDSSQPVSLADNQVQGLLEHPPGTLWVATRRGLHRLRAGVDGEFRINRFQQVPADPTSLVDDYVSSLARQGSAIWAGTRGGLSRVDVATGRCQNFRAGPDGLQENFILSLFADESSSMLWIGTEGGLHGLDLSSNRFRHYGLNDGMASSVISAIQGDHQGRLWLATGRGLTQLDPKTGLMRNYDETHGLPNNSFNRGAAAADGDELLFGGVSGLTRLRPDLLEDNPFTPPTVLTSIKVFNRELSLSKPLLETHEIVLEPDENFLIIEFAGLEFTSPNNTYAYRLDRVGAESDWIPVGARREASFAHMKPGRYRFEVRAANADGVWHESPRRLSIVITSPWWGRRDVQALAAVLGILLVVALYQARTRSVRRRSDELQAVNERLVHEVRERERAEADRENLIAELQAKNTEMGRFTALVAHDLKSPLVTVRGFLGFAQKDVAAGRFETVGEDLEKVANATEKMGHLLEDLLELSRIGRIVNPPVEVSASILAQEAADLVAGALREHKVELVIDSEMPKVEVDRTRIVQVYQNLVDNAVKFTKDIESPRIEIGVRPPSGDGKPIFFVRDNGRGISDAHLEQVFGVFKQLQTDRGGTGLGLAFVRRIVEHHGGRVWAESAGLGHGTTFCMTLPLAGEGA